MAYRPRTVWVLGSGFSRSLGGPLLDELIGKKTKEETEEIFPDLGDRSYVYALYEKHLKSLWHHAEQFLEYIDEATVAGSAKAKILSRHLYDVVTSGAGSFSRGGEIRSYDIEGLRRDAVLTIAAECSTYTASVNVESETWGPYVDWASKLRDTDSILTFNYDRVLEKLGTHSAVRAIGEATVMFPISGQSVVGAGRASIYKVHGSVDWAFRGSGDSVEVKRVEHLEYFATETKLQPLIATPGATKASYCAGMLDPIWRAALKAVGEAEAIVFLGYRFPESDAQARGRILDAVTANRSPFLKVFTVLGTNVQGPDSARLKTLLTRALRRGCDGKREDLADLGRFGHMPKKPPLYSVEQVPLYAQDFIHGIDDKGFYDQLVAKLIGAV